MKQALLQAKRGFEERSERIRDEYDEAIEQATRVLQTHSSVHAELLSSRRQEEALQEALCRTQNQLKGEFAHSAQMGSEIAAMNGERKRLLQWRADTSLAFVDLTARAKRLELAQARSIKELQLRCEAGAQQLQQLRLALHAAAAEEAEAESAHDSRITALRAQLLAIQRHKQQLLTDLAKQDAHVADPQILVPSGGAPHPPVPDPKFWERAKTGIAAAEHEAQTRALQHENAVLRELLAQRQPSHQPLFSDGEVRQSTADSTWVGGIASGFASAFVDFAELTGIPNYSVKNSAAASTRGSTRGDKPIGGDGMREADGTLKF